MDSAFDLLADNFVRARKPNVAGVIASAHALEPGGRFKRRRFLPWNVADDEGKLVLIGPGGDLDFKAEDGDALELALSGAPVQRRRSALRQARPSWSAPSGRRASSSASPSSSPTDSPRGLERAGRPARPPLNLRASLRPPLEFDHLPPAAAAAGRSEFAPGSLSVTPVPRPLPAGSELGPLSESVQARRPRTLAVAGAVARIVVGQAGAVGRVRIRSGVGIGDLERRRPAAERGERAAADHGAADHPRHERSAAQLDADSSSNSPSP